MPSSKLSIAGRELTLDARPDRLDLRDLPYRPPVKSLPSVYPPDKEIRGLLPNYLAAELLLDQGTEGACTGFGLACVINYLLWVRSQFSMKGDQKVSTRMLYQLARFYDEWPGEDYEGSSCRGALKGWHRHGVCVDSLWPYRNSQGVECFIRPSSGWDMDALRRPLGVYYRIDRQSVVDMQAAIFQTGAIYVSANVHSGWDVKKPIEKPSHEKLPVIRPGKPLGGHAFGLVGYNDRGFVVQNSWGPDWGTSGFAVLRYEDWIQNGTDAWVVGLGAPVVPATKEETRSAQTLSPQHFVRAAQRVPGGPGRAGWFATASDPLEGRKGIWSEQSAYAHTIVTGNDGLVLNRLPHAKDEVDNVSLVCREQPFEWLKNNMVGKSWRVAVYAHGGLNSEEDSIQRIRILGPCFKENGIYPLFTTWKSGWAETLKDLFKDEAALLFGDSGMPARGLSDAIVEASDRALEAFLRSMLVKSMWSEMKENVTLSSMSNRGLDLLAEQLTALAQDASQNGAQLEIHLVGHSAGSFVCGRLLGELRQRDMKVNTCTLYAPACDLGFALDHFKPAIERGQLDRSGFRIHVLADKLELDDSVGPYRKSLLYLVSRALERRHKMPLLGLAGAFDPARTGNEYWHSDTVGQVEDWQRFFWGQQAPPPNFSESGRPAPGENLFLLSDSQVSVGPRRIKSSHGCFDNSIAIVSDTLETIINGSIPQKIKNLDY